MSPGLSLPVLRVGQGFDVHPFSDDPGRRLVLGGVHVPGSPGLDGHSDADVVTHALADALLGAAGLGDLGGRFPASDPTLAGADSVGLLRTVLDWVRAERLQPVNADCSIVCERPRLAEHTGAMARCLGDALGAPVAVRAKRAEGLGALGRSEGIVCLAVVLLAGADDTAPAGDREASP
jgi:2-C-methyl-D-erythritol 2,4-cyclodiphosphate synthase